MGKCYVGTAIKGGNNTMRLIVNDVSWYVDGYGRETIIRSIEEFADLCRFVMKRAHKLNDKKIYTVQPATDKHYVSMAKMKGYLNAIEDRDCRAIVVGVLNNSPTIEAGCAEPVMLHDHPTYVFSVSKNNDMLMSMGVMDCFKKDELTAFTKGDQRTLRNIYSIKQSYNFIALLGYRIYKSNPKHNHKRDICRKGGMVNSPMDLDDDTSQKVLDEAIFDEWSTNRRDLASVSVHKSDRLYSKFGEAYYEFQGEDNFYHGYKIPKNELERKCSSTLLKMLDK